ncbi:MAG: O-antigen ligase family protein [Candidatus Methylomirabilia bacterium]
MSNWLSALRTDPLLAAFVLSLGLSISLSQSLLAVLVFLTFLRWLKPAHRQELVFPLAWPMGVFAAATLLSVLLSPDLRRSLFESKDLLLLLTFFVVVNRVQSVSHLSALLTGFFGIMSAMALYGLLQVGVCRTELSVPGGVETLLRVRLAECRALQLFRARGPFSIYMTYGGVLLQSLVLLTARWAALPLRHGGLLTLGGLVQLAALGAAFTRNAWLGLGVGVLSLAALERQLKILAIMVAAGGLLLLSPQILLRARSIVDPTDPTARERFYMWGSGFQMVVDHPLTGVGVGRVGAEYPRYRNPQARKPSTGHLHNSPLQIAAERGVLGLGAWLWIWVEFFRRSFRVLRKLRRGQTPQRVLVASSVAAVAAFLAAGLFEYSFGDSEVVTVAYVVMALPFLVEGWMREPSGGAPPRALGSSHHL